MCNRRRWNRVRKFLLLVVFIASVFALPVQASGVEFGSGEDWTAAETRVFDYAGLFSPNEIDELQEEAVRLRKELKMEFIVLTIADAKNQTARKNADTFYFSHGFEKSFDESGAVILLDMDNREIYLGTYGMMIRVITDKRLEAVLDAAWPEAVDQKYALAALTMLGECESYVRQGIVAGQYNYDMETGRIAVYHSIRWYEALGATLLSALIAGLVCLNVCRRYRMRGDENKSSRLAYQDRSHVQILSSTDQLLHTTVNHVMIPRHNSSSSRSTGGSSVRRSTTHSHGGHRAGGGGRRF